MGRDEETIALIRRLHVLPTDLQLAYSETENQAIAQCRRLLRSADGNEARDLWQQLVNVATETRIRMGTVTVQGLLLGLRHKFELLHHPDFAADWQTLANVTADHKSRIETELPSGYAVPRPVDRSALRQAISENAITVIFGESGAGKSALVKSVLDGDCPSYNQVWFGPEDLKVALSAARRSILPLRHELSETLNATIKPANVLVIDSAERIEPGEFVVIRKLLRALLSGDQEVDGRGWRVVFVTQPQGWDGEPILEELGYQLLELKQISVDEAKLALTLSPTLNWLTGHDDTVAALTNLRTLGWVIKAGVALGSNANGLASHSAIADRLWKYWTHDRADVQAMMMRLAQREASFERSFALTDVAPADTAAFSQRPRELPLRLNERSNRIEFEHDLAADWARFQFLKQIWTDTPQWAALASNPLWTNALRMLGQFLLRQPGQTDNEWDAAYRSSKSIDNTLASDILLDALCLDPDAQGFLTARIDMLLEDSASGFTRLLMRFHHIATVPTTGSKPRSSTLGIYFEIKFRSVILARWPPVLRFLIAHRERLTGLVSAALAQVIETWLTRTPFEIGPSMRMPFRRDLAEMALAMARTVQVQKGHGVIYLSHESSLYTAPLAGARDLPNEVGSWALELAGRRVLDQDVTRRIGEARRKQAQKHTERLKTDKEYRARHERKSRSPGFIGSFHKPLPPWPLGASGKVDADFRTACLEAGALQPLMGVRPEVTAEVLLALIIDDRPEGGHDRYEVDIGLHFPRDAYPTAFWKSPFFPFLQASPPVALGALIALVNFCTERWVVGRTSSQEGPIPGVTLELLDGAVRVHTGRHHVFGWVQSNDTMRNGNLYCALDALERWLIMRVEASEDISADIHRVLHEGNSAALVSVLVNVAKFHPSLLKGPLSALLTFPDLFYWDSIRVKNVGHNFVAWAWLRAGDAVFDLARDWTLAAHRRLRFVDVVTELLLADDDVSRKLQVEISTWALPDDPRAALDYKLLYASLNRANYRDTTDPKTGEELKQLVYPAELVEEIDAWQSRHAKPLEYLMLPDRCRQRLRGGESLSAEEAAYLHGVLCECEADSGEGEQGRARCAIAVASTLLVLGEAWLEREPVARERALTTLRAVIAEITSEVGGIGRRRFGSLGDELIFASEAVMHLWLEDRSDSEWEASLVRLLTSGDSRAASAITVLACARRDQLGSAWWRLLLLGLLWSGMVLLMPRPGESEGAESVWPIWLARLRRFPLKGKTASAGALDFKRVAVGVGRLRYDREMRLYLGGDQAWRGEPERRYGNLLDAHYLDGLFGWLLEGEGTGDRLLDERLTLSIWDYDATRAKDHAKEDRHGEYDLPSHGLGYKVLVKLAALVLVAPQSEQRAIWEPVLTHGPAAHYALEHFVNGLFLRLGKVEDAAPFERMWRPLAEYALTADWSQRGLWFHGERLLCNILGFGHETELTRLAPGAALRFLDLYERWAASHLDRDEDCIVRFARFLTTDFAAPIRLEGLCWIAAILKATRRSGHWYREETGESLVDLAASTLNLSSDKLAKDAKARQALIDILAALAAKNVPAAMPLQERMKLLRS